MSRYPSVPSIYLGTVWKALLMYKVATGVSVLQVFAYRNFQRNFSSGFLGANW